MALVLIVDDEFLVRLNAIDIAERAGHAVLNAANAVDALRILEGRSDIEIVFSDVTMPGGIDGISLVGMIRSRWPTVRPILTSGKSLPSGTPLPAGVQFLPKPYTSNELGEVLASA